jgi:hypothetical protein
MDEQAKKVEEAAIAAMDEGREAMRQWFMPFLAFRPFLFSQLFLIILILV